MKKLMFSVALAVSALFSFKANAQNYFIVSELQNTFATISANNFTISSTQSGTTSTVTPPTGGYSDVSGPLLAVPYVSTPSIIAPLYISVSSGKTLTIKNNDGIAHTYAVRIGFKYIDSNKAQDTKYYDGTSGAVAAGKSIKLTIPTVTNYQYTTSLPTYYDVDATTGYPVIITLEIHQVI